MHIAASPDFWSQESPIWNLLSALLGGLLAISAGVLVAHFQTRATREHESRTFLRGVYQRATALTTELTNAANDVRRSFGTASHADRVKDFDTIATRVNVMMYEVRMLGSANVNSALNDVMQEISAATASIEEGTGRKRDSAPWLRVTDSMWTLVGAVRAELELADLGRPSRETTSTDAAAGPSAG